MSPSSSTPKPLLSSFTKSAESKQSAYPLIRRPIATNSRVKQVEKSRKDMYILYVNDALQKKAQGSKEAFDELVNQFNIKKRKEDIGQLVTELRTWLTALSYVVSRLERTHSALVEAIINLPWTTLDTVTVKSYTEFIGVLLSARPEYLSLVLTRIVQGFTFQYGMQVLNTASAEGSSNPLTRRTVYDRLHSLLVHLLSLIPTLPSTLQPLLVRFFPHKRQGHIEQVTYIRNILRVSGYCPQLSDQILATIVDRAIQMDVEIQVEIEDLEERDSQLLTDQDIFEIDPMDVLVGEDPHREHSDVDDSDNEDEDGDEEDDFSDISSDAEGGEIPTNAKHIRDMVKKLDAILTLIFDHFHRTYGTLLSKNTNAAAQSTPPDLPPLPPLSPHISSTSSLPTLHSLWRTPAPLSPSVTSSTQSLPDTTIPSRSSPSQEEPTDEEDTLRPLLRTQFHTLLSIFDRIILPTFKSRYTQFLIFWYTSLDPEFADIFQGMLVDRALFQGGMSRTASSHPNDQANSVAHMNISTVTRVAAASYIGSFVSRAKFVDREATRRVVGLLCEFMKVNLGSVEQSLKDAAAMGNGVFGGGSGTNGVAGFEQITVFYAVAQAAFLIFCFRWRDLKEDDEDENGILGIGGAVTEDELGMVGDRQTQKKWMSELSILHSVVNSALNPLRVCSNSVAVQFARVTHATAFMYCYPLVGPGKYKSSTAIPPPSSTDIPSTPSSNANLIHPAILSKLANSEFNTFFPFDPYRLTKSGAYIESIYREWASVAIDDDEDDDEEEEDDDDGGEAYSSQLSTKWNSSPSRARKSPSGDSDRSEDGESNNSDSDGAKTIAEASSGGFLAIPGAKLNPPGRSDEQLGTSLGAMSISPASVP